METIKLSNDENPSIFFVTNYGAVLETQDSNVDGEYALYQVLCDRFYVGSMDEWRKSILKMIEELGYKIH